MRHISGGLIGYRYEVAVEFVQRSEVLCRQLRCVGPSLRRQTVGVGEIDDEFSTFRNETQIDTARVKLIPFLAALRIGEFASSKLSFQASAYLEKARIDHSRAAMMNLAAVEKLVEHVCHGNCFLIITRRLHQ